MRRHDREITSWDEILQVIEGCDVCRLALNDEEGYPYILPLNFGMKAEGQSVTLYFHGANAGRKYRLIEQDCRASFEMDRGHRLVLDDETGNCTMSYESVIGRGKLSILPAEEKLEALELLMAHYRQPDFPFHHDVIPRTVVMKLEVVQLTGKRRIMHAQAYPKQDAN